MVLREEEGTKSSSSSQLASSSSFPSNKAGVAMVALTLLMVVIVVGASHFEASRKLVEARADLLRSTREDEMPVAKEELQFQEEEGEGDE